LEALSSTGPFDAVFIDADKGRYPQYARWASEHVRSGGLLIADNVYFFGQLLSDHPDAAAMRAFHQQVAMDFETACVPTPDGMLIGTRKATP
jgi:caffeoyl-CoA O-methyltransferase